MKPEAIKEWRALIKSRGLTLRQASLRAGLSQGYLSTVITRAEHQPDRLIAPSAAVIDKLAELLDVESHVLIHGLKTTEPPKRATLNDVLRWWHCNGGRLEGVDQIMDSFDIIAVPSTTDRQIKPTHVGSLSLASERIGPGLGPLCTALNDMTEPEAAALTEAFYKAGHNGADAMFQSTRSMKVRRGDHCETSNYISVRLPVLCPKTGPSVISYCFLS